MEEVAADYRNRAAEWRRSAGEERAADCHTYYCLSVAARFEELAAELAALAKGGRDGAEVNTETNETN